LGRATKQSIVLDITVIDETASLSPASSVIHVGVQCFVLSDSRILLGLRSSGFGKGTWGLPGGHLEQGESILAAAARELREETGLVAHKMRIAAIGDPLPENNYHLQIGVLVEEWSGNPSTTAPNELGELCFFPLSDLPRDVLVSSAYIIEKFAASKLY
jgi:8-oxo-dGTP diphosphatase